MVKRLQARETHNDALKAYVEEIKVNLCIKQPALGAAACMHSCQVACMGNPTLWI